MSGGRIPRLQVTRQNIGLGRPRQSTDLGYSPIITHRSGPFKLTVHFVRLLCTSLSDFFFIFKAACFFVGNTWRRHTGVRFDAGFLETVCDLTVVTRLSRRAPCTARLAHSLGWITNTVRSSVSN
ncbi:hypothetical protein ATANTOWER_014515 [Ataeniobius toweri]|uniref:Uncharacterized protein n=1 Tax=Ataeniobius toweri TaxID=208326 RepID=A0ABU7AQA0_9TELE|nr:hypothetical protein [Ataeniobius toweri]